MPKLLIVFPLKNSAHNPPQGRFTRSQKYDAHIWDGRAYDTSSFEDMKEFNAQVDKALVYYPERLPRPTVRVVDLSQDAPKQDEPLTDGVTHPSHLQEAITSEEDPALKALREAAQTEPSGATKAPPKISRKRKNEFATA